MNEPMRLRRRAFLGGAAGVVVLSGCRGNSAPNDATRSVTTTSLSSEPVPHRALGKTGVSVSMVGLGGYHIGSVKDDAEAVRMVADCTRSGPQLPRQLLGLS
jgi:hypothetical protein